MNRIVITIDTAGQAFKARGVMNDEEITCHEVYQIVERGMLDAMPGETTPLVDSRGEPCGTITWTAE